MNAYCLLFILLLLGVCFTANGQDKTAIATGQESLMSKVERHQNPDYVAPNETQAGSRRKLKRPKITGEYAIPYGANPDSILTHLTETGMHFRISSDGKWIIINQFGGEGNYRESLLREPLFRQGLFGGPRRNDSFSIIR